MVSMRSTVVLLVTLLALASSSRAQTVTPGSRVLVLDSGKSGTVKIQDADGCTPSWTAVSSDPGVATVTPESAGAGKARAFKVKAAQDVFPAMATVTITLTGTGVDCAQTTEVDVTVVVTRKAKHAESMTKAAASLNLKDFKKERKAAEKALGQSFKSMLKQVELDLEAAGDGEGSGKSKQDILRDAFINGFVLQLFFLSTMMSSYFATGDLVGIQAFFAIQSYGYLPFIAVTLIAGGGGIWDGFIVNLIRFALLSANKSFSLFRVYLGKLAIIAAAQGIPFSFGFLPFAAGICFPPICGPAGFSEESAAVAGRTPASRVASEGGLPGGTIEPGLSAFVAFKLQMLMAMSFTHFFAGATGSILVGGLADPANGDVTVNAQRLGGPVIPAVAVVNAVTGSWWVLFGAGGVGDDLAPGKYQLEIVQGGARITESIAVPAR